MSCCQRVNPFSSSRQPFSTDYAQLFRALSIGTRTESISSAPYQSRPTVISSIFRWGNQYVMSEEQLRPQCMYNLLLDAHILTPFSLITIMGFLDSTVAAKQNADRFGYAISPNRELVALGAANLMGSFVPGTLPAFGSIVRSKINGDVGARTQLASLVAASITLLSTFFLLPYLYFLPRCVLASMYVFHLHRICGTDSSSASVSL